MTRVVRRAASAQAVRARSRLAKPGVRKHKIIMESVTQEKKKLRSVISFESKAPAGYTFIPAGNPELTTGCKELCRKEGHKIYTVSTTPHQRTHNLSQHVHRIGYHFPSVVVASVCMERGLFLSSSGRVLPYEQHQGSGLSLPNRHDPNMSQATINAEARDAIKDLFPNIPNRDVNQIIKTAFQKGKRKVGTAVELPLARRAQLAVVAHIRHVYTNYDRLLKVTSFQEARAAVEEPCLARLVQWRGDDENGKTVLEDVFREVIVISDDEEDEDLESAANDRNTSVEIISSNTVVGELSPRHDPSGQSGYREISEKEPPMGFRFIPAGSQPRNTADRSKVDRRGFSRYEAWDRARDRYRNGVIHPPPAYNSQVTAPSHSMVTPSERRDANVHESGFNMAYPMRSSNLAQSELPMGQSKPPDRICFPDGSVFERADNVRDDHGLGPSHSRLAPIPPRPAHRFPTYGQNEAETIPTNPRQAQRVAINHDRDRRLLQSIEEPPTSPESRDQLPQRRIRSPNFSSKTYHMPPGELDYADGRHYPQNKRTRVMPPSHDGVQDELSQMNALRLGERPVEFSEGRGYPHNTRRTAAHPPNQIPYQPDHYTLAVHRNPNPNNPESGRGPSLRPQPISALDGSHFPPHQPRLANHETAPPRVRSINLIQSPPASGSSRPVIGGASHAAKPNYTYPSARFEPAKRGIDEAWNTRSYPVEPRPPAPSNRAHLSNSDLRMPKRYSDDFIRPIHQGSAATKHYDPEYVTQIRRPIGPVESQPVPGERGQGVAQSYGEPILISSPYQSPQPRIQYLDSPRASQVPPIPQRRPVSYVSGAQREPISHGDWR